LVGGPAEAAVRAARDRLTADAPGAAFDAVEPWLTSGTDGHPRTLVEASVLAAASTATRGRPDEASVHLRTALHRAGTDRVWGPVRDGGPTVVPLLERLARTDGPHQQDALALLDNARPGGDGASAGSLTEQEHVVLRFLPTLMSNPEIARA